MSFRLRCLLFLLFYSTALCSQDSGRLYSVSQTSFSAAGDSLTQGVSGMTPWPVYITFSAPYGILNAALHAKGSAWVISTELPQIYTHCITGQKNVVVLWIGTNDGDSTSGFNLTEAQSWANQQQIAQDYHTNCSGGKIIVASMVSRTGNTGTCCSSETMDTYKNNLNTLIYANYATPNMSIGSGAFFDGLADVAGCNTTCNNIGANGSYSNTTYFLSDGIHTTTLSNQTIEAPIIQTAINPYI